jgi:hypothetical protein
MDDANVCHEQVEPQIDLEAEIERLTKLTPIEYDRERQAAADRLGIRVGTLDAEVTARRPHGDEDDNGDAVENLEPWPEPVDGLALLDAVRADFGRHVVADHESLDACALWAFGTYCYDAFPVWPKLFFSSPERRCGKTVALEVLEANAARGLMASSITSSAIFRAVNAWRPTLIVDEADTFGRDDEELAGIINAGHRKRSAVVVRNVKVGDEYLPKKFSVWAPMAIAAIGRLRDTVMDRSVVVHMRRKAAGERVEKIPPDLFDANHTRRRMCLRWAEDNIATLRTLRVLMPAHGNDRALDNWAPPFAIADLIGGRWPVLARAAFAKLSAEEEDESIGPMLLSDLREVFEERHRGVLFSQELVDALVAMEDRPWCEWRKGRPMTQNSLARLLRPFKIHPATRRVGHATAKGYELRQFRDAFDRYLTPVDQEPPIPNVTPSQPNSDTGSGYFRTVTPEKPVTDANHAKSLIRSECDGVTVEKGGSGGDKVRSVL